MFFFRFLAILAIPVLVYLSLLQIGKRYSLSRNQFNTLVGLSIALIVILVLIVMGRLPVQFIAAPIMVAATFLLRNLPVLLRLLPIFQSLRNRIKPTGNNFSTIRTTWLLMQLQHSNGEMNGEVLIGDFQGKQLSELGLDDLLKLRKECQQDPESFQVLDAYLDRLHPQWREQESDGAGEHQANPNSLVESELTIELALEILGLDCESSQKDIIKAHRHLMQKLHPDRGGTDYLAKKINAAKTTLLENYKK